MFKKTLLPKTSKYINIICIISIVLMYQVSISWSSDVVTSGPECEAIVEVKLKPVKGNYLSLRIGPNVQFNKVGQLYNGDQLWFCSERGDWIGVIQKIDSISCNQFQSQIYRGPCPFGWVHKTFVRLIAG